MSRNRFQLLVSIFWLSNMFAILPYWGFHKGTRWPNKSQIRYFWEKYLCASSTLILFLFTSSPVAKEVRSEIDWGPKPGRVNWARDHKTKRAHWPTRSEIKQRNIIKKNFIGRRKKCQSEKYLTREIGLHNYTKGAQALSQYPCQFKSFSTFPPCQSPLV